MTSTSAIESRWTETTKALLLGFVGYNVLLHQAFVRGIGAPEGASQLMMWVAVASLVAYSVARSGLTAGYWLAAGTGLLSLVFNGVIGSGVLGSLPNDGLSIGFVLGPAANALYAVVLVVVGYLASREHGRQREVGGTSGERAAGAQ